MSCMLVFAMMSCDVVCDDMMGTLFGTFQYAPPRSPADAWSCVLCEHEPLGHQKGQLIGPFLLHGIAIHQAGEVTTPLNVQVLP